MVLSGHLDRWSCVLKSLPQVRPHPWKECPQTIHKELPHGSSPTAKLWHTPKTRGHWCTAAWWRGPPGAFRISRWTRYSLPRQHSLRPFWCNCGTLEQTVPASVLSKKVPCKGRECFSIKNCAWQDSDHDRNFGGSAIVKNHDQRASTIT